MHQEWRSCINTCLECAVQCENCVTACLNEPDVNVRAKCIQTLRDCADICALSAMWMGRDSAYAKKLCALCAEICDACAAECAKFRDDHCQRCANACRECAAQCRKMAGM